MADNPDPNLPTNLKPCRHMQKWLDGLADGSLTGPARWYARLHVSGCKQCQAALEALQRLRERLQALRNTQEQPSVPTTLSPPRRASLEAALDEVERQRR